MVINFFQSLKGACIKVCQYFLDNKRVGYAGNYVHVICLAFLALVNIYVKYSPQSFCPCHSSGLIRLIRAAFFFINKYRAVHFLPNVLRSGNLSLEWRLCTLND